MRLITQEVGSATAMAVSSRPRWYAVQTRSRFEKLVRSHFESNQIEHYLATFDEVHEWKDRKKQVEMPLFPGYIFARFEEADAARLSVLRTNGVVRILGHGSSLEPVPDEQIESIRLLLSAGKRCYRHPFIREGCLVRVKRGALAGIEGRLVQVKNNTRLVLSIDLLSQSVATEIDSHMVEFVPERRRTHD